VGLSPKKTLSAAKIAELIEEESGEMHQPDHYHGLYEDRILDPGNITELSRELDEAIANGTLDRAALREEAVEFTGDRLKEQMERLATLQGELSLIEALRDGHVKLKGKTAKFRDKDCTRGEILEQQGRVQSELKGARERAKEADRAFFRYHYALSADVPEAREELWQRYEFLLAIQALIVSLMRLEGPIEGVLGKLRSGAELTANDVAQMREIFEAGREALVEVARKAKKITPPKLALLDSDKGLAKFVLAGAIVEPFDAEVITGQWIGAFMTQFDGALRRLRKLHFKNLGALLALGERLDPTLFPKAEAPAAEPAEPAEPAETALEA
jgi:hypothetical protein